MEIDWLTVAAQIINFLVLIWLLQRVLYRPLARTLKAREAAVQERLAAAETAKTEAEAAARAHAAATRALEAAQAETNARAVAEAEARRHALMDDIRAEAEASRAKWQAQLEAEKAAFLDRLRRRAGEAFVVMARGLLRDMADDDLADRLARTFARRLDTLPEQDRAPLRAAARAGTPAEIHSALPLSPDRRADLAAAVSRLLEGGPPPRFVEDPMLDCGLDLRLGAQHVGWTIGAALDALETDVAQLLEARITERTR